jgi:cyanophycinase
VSGLGRRSAVLHARDRAAADTDGFVAPLRDASAVWFEGGRQTRLAEAYAGTATERALRGVLDRGGLMAGTSAGATIQGSYLVRGARGDIRAAPGLERAFGYLRNVAVDQHVDARNRDRDLVPLVAATPGLLGLGLDEGTAALVRGDEFGVVGRGRVLVTDGADHGGLPYDVLRPGDRFDLARRRRLP